MKIIDINIDVLKNLDKNRQDKLRSKIENKEISLNIIDVPLNIVSNNSNDISLSSNINKDAPVPVKEEKTSFWGKVEKGFKRASKEVGTFFGAGTQSVVNNLNPLSRITGDLKLVDDIPSKTEMKDNIQRVDDELLRSIESLARTDIRLIGEATDEQKDTYLDNVASILGKKNYSLGKRGDDYVAVDKDGNISEITNTFFDGLIDSLGSDKFEIAGAMAGVAKGADAIKKIPNPFLKVLAIIGYGATGAMAGTSVDTAIASYETEQTFTIEDFFNELNKSAAIEMLGASAGYLVVKVAGKSITAPKKLYDYLAKGNIDGAKSILKKDLGIDAKYMDEALESAKKDYKEVSEYAKTNSLSTVSEQEKILATAQKDKRFGSDLIHDAVLDDKEVATNVAKSIDKRTKDMLTVFDDVQMSGTELKNSIKNYEESTHKQYSDMRDVIKEAFSETDYRFDLKTLDFSSTLKDLSEKVTDPNTKEKFINLRTTIDNIIYDKDLGIGVVKDMDDLIDIRQMMNKFYRKNERALELRPDKESFFELIKSIDTEIESSIRTHLPKDTHKPLMNLFDDARASYKNMYDISSTKLYKSVMSDGMSKEARIDALIKHTADDDKEFETLLKKLPVIEQEKIENSIVKRFMDKNLFGHDFELQVIDYKNITKDLEKLEEFFITKNGKESVSLMKEMALKFGDDIDLMKASNQAGVSTSAGIATTIKGRIEYKIVKSGFDRLMRMIPFSQSSQRLALQHHISSALKKSRTPMDMIKRVVSSEHIPKEEKNQLLLDIRAFNQNAKITRESQARQHLKETEERLKKNTDVLEEERIVQEQEYFESRASALNKDKPNLEELKALDALEGRGNGQFFQNLDVVKDINARQAREYDRAIKEHGENLYLKVDELKYPVDKNNFEKVEQLRDYLLYSKDSKLGDIVNPMKLKAVLDDVKKGKLRSDDYKKTYHDILKVYDEFEPKIIEAYRIQKKSDLALEKELGEEMLAEGYRIKDGFLIDPNGKQLFSNGTDILAGGFFGGSETAFNQRDWNSDGVVDEQDILFGATIGIIGLSATRKMFPKFFDDVASSSLNSNKLNKEKGNISKVAMGLKPSTVIREFDSSNIDNIVLFEKGQHNNRTNRGKGFVHIDIRHMKKGSTGKVSLDELVNIGDIVRNGDLSISNGKRVYTMFKDDVRFRVVTSKSDDESVITFYSNRKLGEGHNAQTLLDDQPSDEIIITYKPQITYKEWVLKQKLISEDMTLGAFGGKAPKDFKDEDLFYSALEKAVYEKVGGKIESVSLAKMLSKNSVKNDELEWSGLKELMNKNKKLTKEEIENTIKENRLLIEVVEKSKDSKYKEYKLEGGTNYRELLFRQANKVDDITQEYTSKHWDESNILVFSRVDDRLIDNKKTLFIEELQSDLHQAGRKLGYNTTNKKDKNLVPNAPFKKNWHELGIKRLLHEAVSKDYDKMAWTTGAEQSKRYSLEETADMIIYNKEAGVLQASNKGEEVFLKLVSNDEELEGIIGKEIATRLVDSKMTSRNNIFVLKDEELKLGGEGMKTFYDSILPSTFKKLFKKYKVKPKIEELDDNDSMVWTIEITQAMKEDIKSYGQPLYATTATVFTYDALNLGVENE